MSSGNKFCKAMGSNDALAKLAVARIRDLRTKRNADPEAKLAYVLTSLKRPEEIRLLRKVYGASFFAIAAYAPRGARVDRLSMQLAARQHRNQSNALRWKAEQVISRDENEPVLHGQDVRKTYPLADFFVRTSSTGNLREAVERFVELIFGNMWHTPSKDEQGMMLAYVASLRSASPARQVGAALTDGDGLVLSTGTNEVSRAGGGQYWEGDAGDGRDCFYDSTDLSDKMRMNLLTDVVTRMRELKLLRSDAPDNSDILRVGSKYFTMLREAQLFDTIDFIRAVHAEMSALLSAKSPTRNSILYVTTFPCHECARHIVAAGVTRVVYVEPYPKSLVAELFRDSIAIDSEAEEINRVSFVPFVGVAPSMYIHMFRASEKIPRKTAGGVIKKWSPAVAHPHLPASYSVEAKRIAETAMLHEFTTEMMSRGIKDEPSGGRRGSRKRVA